MLIPVSVSGWGLREGAAAALFPIVGATAERRASPPASPSASSFWCRSCRASSAAARRGTLPPAGGANRQRRLALAACMRRLRFHIEEGVIMTGKTISRRAAACDGLGRPWCRVGLGLAAAHAAQTDAGKPAAVVAALGAVRRQLHRDTQRLVARGRPRRLAAAGGAERAGRAAGDLGHGARGHLGGRLHRRRGGAGGAVQASSASRCRRTRS